MEQPVNKMRLVALLLTAVLVLLSLNAGSFGQDETRSDAEVRGTRTQDAERPYPKMLPLSQYLMDRNAAIALARSAAPDGISKDASVLVLTPKGWETAVKGTNGFVCMAGPSWTASIDFYDVWSPKQRGRFASIQRLCGRSCRFFAS